MKYRKILMEFKWISLYNNTNLYKTFLKDTFMLKKLSVVASLSILTFISTIFPSSKASADDLYVSGGGGGGGGGSIGGGGGVPEDISATLRRPEKAVMAVMEAAVSEEEMLREEKAAATVVKMR